MSIIEELKVFARGQKILIVEDDNDINKMLVNTFNSIFGIVKSATNGYEALNMYKKERFDIVISDINMPLMNGIDLAKNIKKIKKEQHIIMTSAHNDIEYLIELIDIGVDSFILKPIKFDKLLHKIGTILENNFYQKELQYIETNQFLQTMQEQNEQDTPKIKQKETNIFDARKKQIATIRANTKLQINEGLYNHSHDLERLSARAFMSLLQEDEIVWYKIKQDIYDMVALVSDLDEEVNYLLLNGASKDVLENIIQVFFKMYNILIDIPKCSEIASLFLEIYERLNILDYNVLNETQIKALDLLEYLFEDIKNYVYNVFVDKGAEDVDIYYNLIKSDIEQINLELNEKKLEQQNTIFF